MGYLYLLYLYLLSLILQRMDEAWETENDSDDNVLRLALQPSLTNGHAKQGTGPAGTLSQEEKHVTSKKGNNSAIVLWYTGPKQQYNNTERIPYFYIATLLTLVIKDSRSFIVNLSLQTTPRTPSYLSAY
jgi:hypothetical protein